MFNLDNIAPIEFFCGTCKVKTETFCKHCCVDFCSEHLESGYCFQCYQSIEGRLPDRFSGPDHYLAWLSEWQEMGREREAQVTARLHATRLISDNREDEKLVRNPNAMSVETCSHFGCGTSAIGTCEQCRALLCASHMDEEGNRCLSLCGFGLGKMS